jgi:hypothetical protein
MNIMMEYRRRALLNTNPGTTIIRLEFPYQDSFRSISGLVRFNNSCKLLVSNFGAKKLHVLGELCASTQPQPHGTKALTVTTCGVCRGRKVCLKKFTNFGCFIVLVPLSACERGLQSLHEIRVVLLVIPFLLFVQFLFDTLTDLSSFGEFQTTSSSIWFY